MATVVTSRPGGAVLSQASRWLAIVWNSGRKLLPPLVNQVGLVNDQILQVPGRCRSRQAGTEPGHQRLGGGHQETLPPVSNRLTQAFLVRPTKPPV